MQRRETSSESCGPPPHAPNRSLRALLAGIESGDFQPSEDELRAVVRRILSPMLDAVRESAHAARARLERECGLPAAGPATPAHRRALTPHLPDATGARTLAAYAEQAVSQLDGWGPEPSFAEGPGADQLRQDYADSERFMVRHLARCWRRRFDAGVR